MRKSFYQSSLYCVLTFVQCGHMNGILLQNTLFFNSYLILIVVVVYRVIFSCFLPVRPRLCARAPVPRCLTRSPNPEAGCCWLFPGQYLRAPFEELHLEKRFIVVKNT